jgi:hypothetical protein
LWTELDGAIEVSDSDVGVAFLSKQGKRCVPQITLNRSSHQTRSEYVVGHSSIQIALPKLGYSPVIVGASILRIRFRVGSLLPEC